MSGTDPRKTPCARREIGLVPQQLAIYDKLTPYENLSVFGRLMGVKSEKLGEAADVLLARIGLSARRERSGAIGLSGGMKRRVNIGAALMHGPKLLILDEPTRRDRHACARRDLRHAAPVARRGAGDPADHP